MWDSCPIFFRLLLMSKVHWSITKILSIFNYSLIIIFCNKIVWNYVNLVLSLSFNKERDSQQLPRVVLRGHFLLPGSGYVTWLFYSHRLRLQLWLVTSFHLKTILMSPSVTESGNSLMWLCASETYVSVFITVVNWVSTQQNCFSPRSVFS